MAKAGAGYPRLTNLVREAIENSQEKECIIWSCDSKEPYPQLSVTDENLEIKNKITRINRAVAQYVLERQLSEDEEVDHGCRQTKCINPYHLFVMSKPENGKKKPQRRLCIEDWLIINVWLKEAKSSNNKRSSVMQFLEFKKYSLQDLHTTSNDEINIILDTWNTHLSERKIKNSTISQHIKYVKQFLGFIKKHNFDEMLQREKEVYVEHRNVVAQKEELSKEKSEATFQSITNKNELTALRSECHELRKEVDRLKSENELLRSKLAKKDLEIAPPKLNYS
jgi:hypothetical protein